LLEQIAERRSEPVFQRQMKKNVSGMRVHVLRARHMPTIFFPRFERAEKFRQRIMLDGPGRMVLRQQQPRRVRRELADRESAHVAALFEIGQKFSDRIIKLEFAAFDRQSQ
jgi:hypothetical protein